jgi:hypothetical protein
MLSEAFYNCYAECHMLSVIILNVFMLNVIMLNVIMLNVIMLNVIMLNVIMLNVIMLNLVAPMKILTLAPLGKTAANKNNPYWLLHCPRKPRQIMPCRCH